jgi:2,3-dimethylmalate lyase
MKKTKMLRKALAEEELLVLVGAYDGASAKAVEQAGFKAVFVGGFSTTASVLGKPDVGLLTMTEMVTHARNMAGAVNIPVLADAEAGYGGISNVQRTVTEFEKADVAGIFIEDQMHPVMCGGLRKFKRIISQDEMLMRIKAALESRKDPDFLIAARTDSDIVSVDEQIKRCNAFIKAGADMVMPIPSNRQDLERIANEIKAPLWIMLWPGFDLSVEDVKRMGIRGMLLFPVETLLVATKAVMDLLQEVKTKGTIKETFAQPGAMDYRAWFNFIGLRPVIEFEKKYTGDLK